MARKTIDERIVEAKMKEQQYVKAENKKIKIKFIYYSKSLYNSYIARISLAYRLFP